MNLVSKAKATITNPVVPGGSHPSRGALTLGRIIAVLWRTVIILGGLAFLIFFIWGGIEWIMAGGDKQKIETAKNKISQGLIGLAILAGSLAIVKFVGPAIGINILQVSWPTPNQRPANLKDEEIVSPQEPQNIIDNKIHRK